MCTDPFHEEHAREAEEAAKQGNPRVEVLEGWPPTWAHRLLGIQAKKLKSLL